MPGMLWQRPLGCRHKDAPQQLRPAPWRIGHKRQPRLYERYGQHQSSELQPALTSGSGAEPAELLKWFCHCPTASTTSDFPAACRLQHDIAETGISHSDSQMGKPQRMHTGVTSNLGSPTCDEGSVARMAWPLACSERHSWPTRMTPAASAVLAPKSSAAPRCASMYSRSACENVKMCQGAEATKVRALTQHRQNLACAALSGASQSHFRCRSRV